MRSIVMLILGTLSALSPAQTTGRRTLVGYLAAFKGFDGEMQQPELDQYTQLDLAFVNPTPDAELLGLGGLACAPAVQSDSTVMISDAHLRALVANPHRSRTKVVASLGGALIPRCGVFSREAIGDAQPAASRQAAIGAASFHNRRHRSRR